MLGHRTGRGGGPAGHRVPGLPLRALHVRTLRRPPLHRRTLLSLCGAGLLLPGRVVVRPLLVDLRPLQRTARARRGTPPHRRAWTSVAVVLLNSDDDTTVWEVLKEAAKLTRCSTCQLPREKAYHNGRNTGCREKLTKHKSLKIVCPLFTLFQHVLLADETLLKPKRWLVY